MPLRSVKMNRFIFGFQRRVWCPKWTPLSSSCFMLTTAMPCSLPVARGAGRRAPRLTRPPGGAPPWRPQRHSPGGCPPGPRWRLTRRRAGGGRAKSTRANGSRIEHTSPERSSSPADPVVHSRRCSPPPGPCGGQSRAVPRSAPLPLLLLAVWLAFPGAAGAAPFPAVPAPAAPWSWPLAGRPPVTRPFDAPDSPYGAGHRGVDLAGAPGVPVLAAGAGVVAFAGMVAGRPVVSIDHPGGLRTTYEPVAPAVAAGQPVVRGSPLGTLQAGHAGCPVQACPHWGLRRGETY